MKQHDDIKVKLPFESIDFTKNGECSKCGNCCSNLLPLRQDEIDKLKRIVRKRNIKPHRYTVFNATNDMTCPFLNDKQECRIYDDRPYICKLYKCNKTHATVKELNILQGAKTVNLRETIFDQR